MLNSNIFIALQILGGIGLLLYGVRLMSSGLQMVAGRRLRNILALMTTNRVVGVTVGVITTALVQSSTAITVTVVGFVNASLLSFSQGLCIMVGANVGTTLTAQLIAFKLTDVAMPAIFLGVCLIYSAKKNTLKHLGEVLTGFGLLFMGLKIMQSSLAPLSTNPDFIAFFTLFAADTMGGIFLNVLVGVATCMCLQASSVAIGVTMVLASQGLLTLPGAVALVLGDNIGTVLTAELAAIGSNLAARQAARANSLFNVFGVCYMLIFFHPFLELVQFIGSWMGTGPAEYTILNGEKPNIARHIANSHTIFNVINATLFTIALPILIKSAILLTPKGKQVAVEDLTKLQYINYRYKESTSASLTEVRMELARMGEIARNSFANVIRVPFNRDKELLTKWQEPEAALNSLQRQITKYLVHVSQTTISKDESNEISLLMRETNYIERIGDSVENLAKFYTQLLDQNLEFTERGKADYQLISNVLLDFMDKTIAGLAYKTEFSIDDAQKYEDTIDSMRNSMRDDHIDRLRNGHCSVDAGLIFVNIIANYERIGDYLYNIALIMKDLHNKCKLR